LGREKIKEKVQGGRGGGGEENEERKKGNFYFLFPDESQTGKVKV